MEERQISILILLLSIIFFFCGLLLSYLGLKNTKWIAREILKQWNSTNSYISETQKEALRLLNEANQASQEAQQQYEKLIQDTLDKANEKDS